MLKLLKYEWKACARTCLPMYGALLLMAIVNHIMYSGGRAQVLNGIPSTLVMMLYFGILVAVFVVTTVILVQRFYKNLLGSEGYLMFTLPVTVSQHILSKTVIATGMTLLGGIAAMLSIGIVSGGFKVFAGLGNTVKAFVKEPVAIVFALELLLLAVLVIAGIALFVYLCIALGHLAKKHRLLMAVVWYFVLSTALQFAMLIVMMGAGNVVPESFVAVMRTMWNGITPEGAMHLILLCGSAAALIGDAVYFFATRWILAHKLNLE